METAIWPHLYPLKTLCESNMYAGQQWKPFGRKPGDCNRQHESAKAHFISKLCGPLADYALRYDLLQFQFDRHILRTVLTSSKADASLVTANQHRHWTPQYWRKQHAFLQDVTRQLGPPHLFLTIAPWEWDFPFPYRLGKLMDVTQRGPTQLAGPETLALAHAFREFCGGYLAGYAPHRPWSRNLFSNKATGQRNVAAYVGRFEFQEGGPTHQYGKGRGSLHCHLLFWFQDARASCLERALTATWPEDADELQHLLEERQHGYAQTNNIAPPQEEPSHWVWMDRRRRWALHMQHSADFVARRLRPCLTSVLRILRCHSDAQWWDGSGALLRYCVGYVAKYQEAWSILALGEGDTVPGRALALLRGWKAAEAEMVLVLARQPMVFSNFVGKTYLPPRYGDPEDTALHLYIYRRRGPALEGECFLEWLRHHTVAGCLEDHDARAIPQGRQVLTCVGVLFRPLFEDVFFGSGLCSTCHTDWRRPWRRKKSCRGRPPFHVLPWLSTWRRARGTQTLGWTTFCPRKVTSTRGGHLFSHVCEPCGTWSPTSGATIEDLLLCRLSPMAPWASCLRGNELLSTACSQKLHSDTRLYTLWPQENTQSPRRPWSWSGAAERFNAFLGALDQGRPSLSSASSKNSSKLGTGLCTVARPVRWLPACFEPRGSGRTSAMKTVNRFSIQHVWFRHASLCQGTNYMGSHRFITNTVVICNLLQPPAVKKHDNSS